VINQFYEESFLIKYIKLMQILWKFIIKLKYKKNKKSFYNLLYIITILNIIIIKSNLTSILNIMLNMT